MSMTTKKSPSSRRSSIGALPVGGQSLTKARAADLWASAARGAARKRKSVVTQVDKSFMRQLGPSQPSRGEARIRDLFARQSPDPEAESQAQQHPADPLELEKIKSKNYMLTGGTNSSIVDKVFTQRRQMRIIEPQGRPVRADMATLNGTPGSESKARRPTTMDGPGRLAAIPAKVTDSFSQPPTEFITSTSK